MRIIRKRRQKDNDLKKDLRSFAILIGLVLFSGLFGRLSGQTLAPADFWQRVKNNHPLARQAALLLEQGAQELLYARGGFDPKPYAAQEQKIFDGTDS